MRQFEQANGKTGKAFLDQRDWVEYVINRFSKPLIRYCSAILKNQEVAKEIVQDCFLKLLESDTPHLRTLIPAWLYRECRNRSIDYWRRQRKTETLTQEIEDGMVFVSPSPLDEIETRADIERMKKNISKLAGREQEIVWLKFNDGLSYKEIAEVMNLTVTNVGFILCQAVTKLREASEEDEAKPVTVAARRSW